MVYVEIVLKNENQAWAIKGEVPEWIRELEDEIDNAINEANYPEMSNRSQNIFP